MSRARFLQNFQGTWAVSSTFDSYFKFGGIRSKCSEVIEFNLGCVFPRNFQGFLKAKLDIGSENVLRMHKLYGLLYDHAEYGGARTSRATEGRGGRRKV